MTNKKMIEVALPLEAINVASAREKSIRHGHPSTLHLWWARRPLAAARAVIFSQMVDDPAEYLTDEAEIEQERLRLFGLLEALVRWENTTNEGLLEKARAEIRRSWARQCLGNEAAAELSDAGIKRKLEAGDIAPLPGFHDPFAGGGALPLEAQRLGLEAYASDLNPVAVLINKAMIEIPPHFANMPPINPDARAKYLEFLGPRASRPHSHSHSELQASRPPPDDSPPPLGTWASRPQTPRPHKAWHSRGYLPHFDQPELIQTISFRLADSVPAKVISQWRAELNLTGDEPADDPRCAELRERIEKYADAGKGQCWLRKPDIATIVQDALLHFDGERYRLLAWCIMPNHVHVMIETIDGFPLGDIIHSWKSFTAKACNKVLQRTGEFWMPDYYDRYIRDANHFSKAMAYIVENPVKAGLCGKADEWTWSSAGGGRDEGVSVRARARAGGTPAVPGRGAGFWKGAQGLAEDVRYYGQWMREEAMKRIGHLYPPVKAVRLKDGSFRHATPEEIANPKTKVEQLTVIAWLWARTVRSPNPAFAHVKVPLASTFMLSTKAGKEAYVEPVIEGDSYRFTVKTGKPKDAQAAKMGTTAGKRAAFRCLLSGVPITYDHIRSEGKAGRMGTRLMAIVAEGDRGRVYFAPTAEHEGMASQAKPEWKPDTALPVNPRDFKTPNYGLSSFGDLFTDRQLVALTTFSDLVGEARRKVLEDFQSLEEASPDFSNHWKNAGEKFQRLELSENKVPRSGTSAEKSSKHWNSVYADAVATYLAFAVDRTAMTGNSLVRWNGVGEKAQHYFGRQALPMLWDFAEPNFLAFSTGSLSSAILYAYEPLCWMVRIADGFVFQRDAATQAISSNKIVSSDPPYYDNIGYADLSDFFYVWLRRSLKDIYPDLFATLAVPKAEELVATPYRHGSKEKAESFFLDGMTQAMHRLAEQAHSAFPVTIYYAFKQSETTGTDGTSSTGWETFLDAVMRAGFSITGTWPMRTEMKTRQIAMGTNALASSIVLVCRRRGEDTGMTTRRDFQTQLRRELPGALRSLQHGNIAPVDLAQSSIGPGMSIFSRYGKVVEADGTPMRVRTALALINEALDEILAEQEGELDADSRWAVAWFSQFGTGEGAFGVAENLCKAKGTSVEGLKRAGIVEASGGKVNLLRRSELNPDWDPAADARPTVWEATQHLIRKMENEGEMAAAALLSRMGGLAEQARDLAYRLYNICDRKGWAEEARSYNGLITAWLELARLSSQKQESGVVQSEMSFG